MAEPMSEARLAEIEARVRAAQETRMPPNLCYGLEDGSGEYGSEAEADFLVQGLVDVPDLLAEIRRLRAADREDLTRYHEQAMAGAFDG